MESRGERKNMHTGLVIVYSTKESKSGKKEGYELGGKEVLC